MQPNDIVEVVINCRAVTKTGVWRSYTVGQQFTVISTDDKEAKLRDFCGQVVLMPVARLQIVEREPGPNDAGPGEQPGQDEHELQVQEAIGAFMAERLEQAAIDRYQEEQAEAFHTFTEGLLETNIGWATDTF